MHNQVVIIGGGPSGTLLALILAKANIDVLVLERMTKEYVLSRYKGGCFGMEHSRHVNEKWSWEKNEC